jgi:hypothetical protein
LTFKRIAIEQEADACGNGLIATPERKTTNLDFSYFIWTELYSMIVPLPEEEPRLFAFVRPFQPTVRKSIRKIKGDVIISFGKFIDTGLATPFHNHNRSGFIDESLFKIFFNLHQ